MRLLSSVGSGDTTIDVDTLYQPASTDGLLLIDAEKLAVSKGFGGQHLTVRRGVAGTSGASHDAGSVVRSMELDPDYDVASAPGGGSISATDGTTTVAALTSLRLPAGTLSDLGAGGGGLGLVLSRIGPFVFAYDSALDIDGSWHTVLALAPGVLVVRTWAVFDEDFDVASQAIQLSLLGGGNHSHSVLLARYPGAAPSSSTFVNEYFESEPSTFGDADALTGPNGSFGGPIATAKTGAVLVATYEQFTPSQGSCRIYAIIATPAA